MGLKGNHITGITAVTLIGIAYLCKIGKFGSYGNTAKICQLFKPGIPGINIAGGGAVVTIGSKSINLAALLLKLKNNGIGDQSLNAIQIGDRIPSKIYSIGYRSIDIDGNKFEVQGYILSPIFSATGQRTLGYQVVLQNGAIRHYSPAMIDQSIDFVTVT